MALERRVAAANGEEYAEVPDLGLAWDTAAPLPYLLSSGHHAFVLFRLIRDQHQGGTAEPRSVTTEVSRPIEFGLVEFVRPSLLTFGEPNDEGLSDHRLYGKGLDFYAAHEVQGSQRLRDAGGGGRHYVFTFQDETLECVADDLKTERIEALLPDALSQVAQRLA
ncbi:MAG TPA: hypothetical protein VGH27_30195 [Streptosporangiaceae bacterium]